MLPSGDELLYALGVRLVVLMEMLLPNPRST